MRNGMVCFGYGALKVQWPRTVNVGATCCNSMRWRTTLVFVLSTQAAEALYKPGTSLVELLGAENVPKPHAHSPMLVEFFAP